EDISSEILKKITDPDGFFAGREFACQSERHFKPESAEFSANRLFVVIERSVTVRDEMEVAHSAVRALVRADAIKWVGTTQHLPDDRAPVLWFLAGIDRVNARVDRGPPGGGVFVLVATPVFGEIYVVDCLCVGLFPERHAHLLPVSRRNLTGRQ